MEIRKAYYDLDPERLDRLMADLCIGCGKCSRICPAEAIEMKDEHPVWIKETCFMCFGCLRLCPTAAIRYGDIEQSKCAIAKVS